MEDNAKKLERIKNSQIVHSSSHLNVDKIAKDNDRRAVKARKIFNTPAYDGIYDKYKEAIKKHKENK